MFLFFHHSEIPAREPITQIDEEVSSKLSEFGFDTDEVDRVLREAIANKTPPTELNPILMVYHLSKEKIERDHAKVQADSLAAVSFKKRSSVILSESELFHLLLLVLCDNPLLFHN